MPSLDEFFHKPERLGKPELQKMTGMKPCSKCDKDAEEGFWDPTTFQLTWTCPDGHVTQHTVA
jgi:hypothetical protein